ncbi:MAG: hypothetical protein A3G24_08315 [Betaproteobacteria bacterium RIFCSPLOWO2_12_FULL_62_13]|nr:MAG: hypothetical protein A3G24_08315 [Betaproteobacteria bacterium RIFCSPLOWO2_12_FULL_62_13]
MIPEMLLIAILTAAAAIPTETAQRLSVSLRVLDTQLRQDRSLTFEVRLCNKGAQLLELTLPSAQIHDIVVTQQRREVWRWSRGKMFAAVLTPLSLAPGCCTDYRVYWKTSDGVLRDSEGGIIKPGSYEAAAVLKARPEIWSTAVSLKILPAE